MAPITHIKKGRVLGYKQLWIYKDKKGKNASRIIEYLFDSTENYKKGQVNLKRYTGLIVIKDWEDEYIGGFLMQNGQTTGAITAFGYEKPTGSTPKSGKTASGFACGFQTSCSTRWVETPPSGGAAIGSASSPPSYVGSPSGYYATVCETNYICVYEESTGMGYPSNGSSNNPGATIVGNFENLWGTSGGSPSSGTPPSEADVFFNQMAWAGVYFSEEEKSFIRNYPSIISTVIEYINVIGEKPDLTESSNTGSSFMDYGELLPTSFNFQDVGSNWRAAAVSNLAFIVSYTTVPGVTNPIPAIVEVYDAEFGIAKVTQKAGMIPLHVARDLVTSSCNLAAMEVRSRRSLFSGPNRHEKIKVAFKAYYLKKVLPRIGNGAATINIPIPTTSNIPITPAVYR